MYMQGGRKMTIQKSRISQVKVLDRKAFAHTKKNMRTEKMMGTYFALGTYVDSLLQTTEIKDEFVTITDSVQPESSADIPHKTYGKGCVIYIDQDTNKLEVHNKTTVSSEKKPELYQAEKKVTTEITINRQDLEPLSLQKEWEQLYTEGGSSPRNFSINVIPLLPKELQACSVCNVLFETKERSPDGQKFVPITVSIVAGTLESGNSDVHSNVIKDFAGNLTKAKVCNGFWHVKDVIDLAITCASQLLPPKIMMKSSRAAGKKSARTLRLFSDLFGWKSESFSLCGAQKLLEEDLAKNIPDGSGSNDWLVVAAECGICFEEFEGTDGCSGLTTLMACGHSFCSECWERYLKTQIHKGSGHIKCPGHKCVCAVDDITIMSLVPSWYNKFLVRKLDRGLEMSANWKWCPETGCKRIVKATAPMGDSVQSVLCSCGATWCFRCQKHAHWPASCEESKKFYDAAGNYEYLFKEEEDLITSVMVKNCPNCNYPIEKHTGCNYMLCILCQTSFCWFCLTSFSKHQDGCKEPQYVREVDLPVSYKGFNRFELFLEIVVQNTHSRMSRRFSVKEKKVKALETGIASYCSIASAINAVCRKSTPTPKLLDSMVKYDIPGIVREGIEFAYQAHLALEGIAKKAAVSRVHRQNVLLRISQLGFVVERVYKLCEHPSLLCKNERWSWLSELINIGKGCILTLGKFEKK